jgi:hypothetical protein
MNARQSNNLIKGVFLVLIGLAAVIAAILYFGPGYGKVGYPTYQAATALYGACLAKSEPRVQSIEALIINGNEEFDAEIISEQERAWLDAVVATARSGEWDSAAAMAKRMMEDQNSADGG